MPKIYVFGSKNLTCIWAAIAAGKWAVTERQAESAAIRTKSQSMGIGSLGLFYSTDEQALTTPFVVVSQPDLDGLEDDVWPDNGYLPFRIMPLGTPHWCIRSDELEAFIPSLQARNVDWTALFHVQPLTAFAPSVLSDAEWAGLVQALVPRRPVVTEQAQPSDGDNVTTLGWQRRRQIAG